MPSSDGVALVTRQLAVQRVRHGLGALIHTHTAGAHSPPDKSAAPFVVVEENDIPRDQMGQSG